MLEQLTDDSPRGKKPHLEHQICLQEYDPNALTIGDDLHRYQLAAL